MPATCRARRRDRPGPGDRRRLKRKVRNFVGSGQGRTRRRFEIYVKEKAILNQQHERAYVAARSP